MHSLEEYRALTEEHLTDLMPAGNGPADILTDSMTYSLKAGGKRLRPSLLLAAFEFAGGDIETAIPFAVALECIHTYSLIHDDLPAMDDDDLRRGKPTNHKVFGDDIAILAGDGLLNTAAEALTGEILKHSGDLVMMERAAAAAHEILSRAGTRGMIAGQTADMKGESQQATAELVRFIEEHKTADLIIAPVRAGLMLAGADDDMLARFTSYAEDIGIAFQILDDILDFRGDPQLLGKATGRDLDLGKCSYVCVHGMDAAIAELHRLTAEAKEVISVYGSEADFFIKLADELEVREY